MTNPTLLQAAKETATRPMKPVGSPLCVVVFYLSALTLQHITQCCMYTMATMAMVYTRPLY